MTFYKCCGAVAARSRTVLVEPEQQRDAPPAPTAPAPNLMFKKVDYQKCRNCNHCCQIVSDLSG
jgi:hypothetical protein